MKLATYDIFFDNNTWNYILHIDGNIIKKNFNKDVQKIIAHFLDYILTPNITKTLKDKNNSLNTGVDIEK